MYRGKITMKQYFSEKYLLKDNPFAITPSIKDIVWADRSDLLSSIERTIKNHRNINFNFTFSHNH
jgi:hypothetical protein